MNVWLIVVTAVVVLLAATVVGTRLAVRRDRSLAPMAGRLVDVDGIDLHVVVEGSGPVVLFDSGLAGSTAEWAFVADELRGEFTVVRYDRPGFGWSPAAPVDGRPVAVATRINDLLAALDLPLPALLVGHSLGGLHVRVAASLFPEVVSGLVLVDPSHEDMLSVSPPPKAAAVQTGVIGAIAATSWLGTGRVFSRLYLRMAAGQIRRNVDRAELEDLRRSTMLTVGSASGLRAMQAELAVLTDSLAQVSEVTAENPLPDIPMTLITACAPAKNRMEASARVTIRGLHEALVEQTPSGRLVLAESSGHLVPLDQPELVARCVRETSAAAR